MVYGTHLRLPGGFSEAPRAFEHTRPVDFLPSLRRAMNSFRTAPVICYGTAHTNWPTALKNCTHVFIRRDKHKPPLTPVRWSLPGGQQVRQVLHCRHVYEVRNNSVDHLKPAPVDDNTVHLSSTTLRPQVKPGLNVHAAPFVPTTTRSGCTVKPTQCLIEQH